MSVERCNEEHSPKSEGRLLVDLDFGKKCIESIKKACWWRSSTSKHTAQGRNIHQKSLFEKFTTEGDEKTDEFATQGATMDGGDVAQVGAFTIQQGREVVHAALQYAATVWWKNGEFVKSLDQSQKKRLVSANRKGEIKKHRKEWRAAANKYWCENATTL